MKYFRDEFDTLLDSINNENDELTDLRKKSFENFIDKGLPTNKWEDWQFTNFSFIEKGDFRLSSLSDAVELTGLLPGRIPNTYLIVSINGYYQPNLSDIPDEAKVASGADHFSSDFNYQSLKSVQSHQDRGLNPFYMLNTSMMNSGLSIHIKDNAKITKPIQIIYLTTSITSEIMNHPRFVFQFGNNSEATVVEHYIGSTSTPYFNNSVTKVELGENSFVNHIRIQEESEMSHHVANTFYDLNKDSNLNVNSVSLGSSLFRHNIKLKFCGDSSSADYSALSLINDQQHHDQHIIVEHMSDACQSNQLFKYILSDQSSGVFNGKVIVEEHTKRTDASQSNKNLVLSPSALMNANPQLEIYAEDVKCSHGSTTGQIDPEALFYLKSRGLGHEKSMELIMNGFISDILELIKNEDIGEYLNKIASQQLEKILK
ncbi:MAG: Fe-S cluster assembly protein SufD [Candidatus Marinimicrobia bacterium TMED108]|nr:MAG: Fe-S cluster assembly protein SufD [Candidatus Marinimicrobia bacterium TMED108]